MYIISPGDVDCEVELAAPRHECSRIVSAKWVWACAQAARLLDPSTYELGAHRKGQVRLLSHVVGGILLTLIRRASTLYGEEKASDVVDRPGAACSQDYLYQRARPTPLNQCREIFLPLLILLSVEDRPSPPTHSASLHASHRFEPLHHLSASSLTHLSLLCSPKAHVTREWRYALVNRPPSECRALQRHGVLRSNGGKGSQRCER